MLTQRGLRITGLIALAGAGVMAASGVYGYFPKRPIWALLAYWVIFLALLLTALYIAYLDYRFTRMQYKVAKRKIFQETIGEEGFRKALMEAAGETPPEDRDADPPPEERDANERRSPPD
jgi:hypothetical protein